jgi:hypothetical protein
MTSELKVDKITPASGTNTQIGEAGDTTNLSAGTVTLPTTIITGQSAKTSLADADKFLISDSAASGAFKYVESQYVGGGAWQLIYSDNVSGMGSGSNAYSDSILFSSEYDFYRVYILNWEPQNDSIDMNIQFTLGGSLRTSNYRYHLRREESNSADKTGAYDNSASSIRIFEGCGNGTSENMSGFFEYQNPTGDNGNYYCTTSMYSGIESNGYTIGGIGQGSCSDSTGAMTGFTIKAHSGGLGNYNLRAYGLKQS